MAALRLISVFNIFRISQWHSLSCLSHSISTNQTFLSFNTFSGWWRWALVTSPDAVAPTRMVGVSASVNLPLHHKVQKFSSGTGSPGWSRKKGRKRLWCGNSFSVYFIHICLVRSQSIMIILNTVFVSDIAIFVLKRDVELQLTNSIQFTPNNPIHPGKRIQMWKPLGSFRCGYQKKVTGHSYSQSSFSDTKNPQHSFTQGTHADFSCSSLVSDIAILVLKRDVKLQLTN